VALMIGNGASDTLMIDKVSDPAAAFAARTPTPLRCRSRLRQPYDFTRHASEQLLTSPSLSLTSVRRPATRSTWARADGSGPLSAFSGKSYWMKSADGNDVLILNDSSNGARAGLPLPPGWLSEPTPVRAAPIPSFQHGPRYRVWRILQQLV
jgi:hypothetical protein